MSNEREKRETSGPEISPDFDATGTLLGMARAFLPSFKLSSLVAQPDEEPVDSTGETRFLKAEARYQVLLEQLPAVTFMAAFEGGFSEIYVSPQIETLLGYTVREWTESPILWYERLHSEDKERWNMDFSRTVVDGTVQRGLSVSRERRARGLDSRRSQDCARHFWATVIYPGHRL